jgi:hypothetical protein
MHHYKQQIYRFSIKGNYLSQFKNDRVELLFTHLIKHFHPIFHIIGGCHGRDRMVVRFI